MSIFSQYNTMRVHVSIESLLDTSTISSIEFLQKHEGESDKTTEFSFLNDNGKMEGKVEDIHEDIPIESGLIKCKRPNFYFDGTPVPKGNTIMIRCAIESKFIFVY